MSGPPGAEERPDAMVGWSPEAPRRSRVRRPPTSVMRTLGAVAACYLSALLVLNLSTSSSYAGFIARIFPHFGGGASLDQTSIAAEWLAIQENYVIRGVPVAQGAEGAEQGIVQILHDTYNDRFSAYLSAAQYQQLNSTLGGRREGSIGIAVEARCDGMLCASGQTANMAVIENVLVNQPADRAGVHRGDVLVAVDGTSLASLGSDESTRIDKAASLVRGGVSTSVRLTVMRGTSQLTLVATRANLQIPSVYSTVFGHVLYMEVTGFDTDTGTVARTQLLHGIAAGATSIILDLRQNGGGYVSAAQSLVSEFVQPTASQRNVVVRKGRLPANGDPNGAQEVVDDAIQSGGVALSKPLVVLVDEGSASAAEITAAALRDYHRATVVGEKTFGKGSVQVDFPLPDGADLHLTVERWYGPDGESIEGSGITPDRTVALASPDARFELDAQSGPAGADAQLQAALAAAGP